MFRILHSGYSLPISLPVDPNSIFEPGMVAELQTHGNQVVCGTSSGLAPLGIIDDIKTTAFHAPSINEIVIAGPVQGITNSNGQLVTPVDIKVELENPNIMADSFISHDVDVELIPRNGVVVVLANTPLNTDLDGDGVFDSIRTTVSYTYQIPGIGGDDSTQSSGRITVWYQRMIAMTDKFETQMRYPINANLFVSENALLTTRQPSENHPSVAIVTAPPSTIVGALEFMWI